MPGKMREPFTAEFLRGVVHYDPKTGVFTWLRRSDCPPNWNTRYAGTVAGYLSHGYRYIQIKSRVGLKASRLAWLYMTGEWPKAQVDHEDLNRANDRWENLRLATNAQNNQNRLVQANNRCGVRGVYEHLPGVWRARITANGVDYDLGCYTSLAEAAAVRKRAEQLHHKEFAPTAPSGS